MKLKKKKFFLGYYRHTERENAAIFPGKYSKARNKDRERVTSWIKT